MIFCTLFAICHSRNEKKTDTYECDKAILRHNGIVFRTSKLVVKASLVSSDGLVCLKTSKLNGESVTTMECKVVTGMPL